MLLKRLGCPMAFEITEDSILIPGQLRFDLLEWIFTKSVSINLFSAVCLSFSRIDEDWRECTSDSTMPLSNRMVLFASQLGLCTQVSGLPLIEGTALPDEQIDFFRRLIEFAATLVDAPEKLWYVSSGVLFSKVLKLCRSPCSISARGP